MPVWALALSVLLPMIYVLPSGFIYAMSGQAVGSLFTKNIFRAPESSHRPVDFAQFACGNYSRDIASWPAPRQHVLQGVLSADSQRIDVIRTGPKAWPLHQGPASCDLPWCVTFALL